MSNKNDRWSALSLKDRADLMNMYITNGISDLKEMKKHYNSFGDGGNTEGDEKTPGYTTTTKQDLQDVDTFNSNWYKYRDKQLADAVRAYHAPQHITRGLSFWQNSYPRFVNDTKLANGARNYINERLEALKEFTIEEAVKDKQAKQLLIDDYYKYFPNERTENEVEIGPPRIPDNQSLIRLHNFIYKGGYSKPAHLITYSNGYENTSTKIHERAHASIYQDVLGYHSVLQPIRNVVLKQGVNAHKYYDKLTEVYSRLMQLRFENNIDPTHTYTLDDVKAMRNDPNFKDHHIFDRYTDESILMLLNDVAQNTTNQESLDYINPDNIAAFGGKLNSFSGEENHPTEVQQGLQNGTIKAIKKDDGTYTYIRQEKPIEDLTQSIAEWTAAGDLIDAAVAIDAVRKGDLKQAALLAGLAIVPNALENTVKLGRRVITHNLHPDKLNAILKGKWDKKMANPSMAIRNIEDITTQEYGPITFLGKPEMLDDSFIFRGDGETSMVSALGLTNVPDVEEVSKIMREYDAKQHSFEYNEPLTKEEVISNVDLTPSWMGYMEAKRSVPTSPKDFERAFIFTGDYKYDPQIQETLELFRNEGIPYTIYGGRGESLPQAVEGYINRNNPNLLFNNGGKL